MSRIVPTRVNRYHREMLPANNGGTPGTFGEGEQTFGRRERRAYFPGKIYIEMHMATSVTTPQLPIPPLMTSKGGEVFR